MSKPPFAMNSEDVYALSWQCAQDGTLAIDLNTGIIVEANPAATMLMGYAREELIGFHVTQLHPEDERARVQAEFVATAGRAATHEGMHIQRKNGSCVPVDIWSSRMQQVGGQAMTLVEIRDISVQVRHEHQLSSQSWALSAFSIAALALGRAKTAEGLLQSICEAVTRQSGYVLAWVGIAEQDDEKTIRVAACAGSSRGYLDGLPLSWSEEKSIGRGPVGVSIRTGTLQIMDDIHQITAFQPWQERAAQFGIRSALVVPLRVEGSWQGVFTIYAASPRAFEAAPVEVFQLLGEQVVHGVHALNRENLLEAERLQLEETQRHLTEALAASVSAMVTAMEMRDPYTAGHETRVADIAVAIGREMGWGEAKLQGLRLAAMVHDIGKISIPTEILTKPGRLTASEYSLVKEHPETGFAILRDIPFTWPVAEMVRQHHEKIDGSGYPLALKGDAILAESKVLAVADIVEAMASDRPYRQSVGIENALQEIESMAGMQLDAEAVRICALLFRKGKLIVPGLHWR